MPETRFEVRDLSCSIGAILRDIRFDVAASETIVRWVQRVGQDHLLKTVNGLIAPTEAPALKASGNHWPDSTAPPMGYVIQDAACFRALTGRQLLGLNCRAWKAGRRGASPIAGGTAGSLDPARDSGTLSPAASGGQKRRVGSRAPWPEPAAPTVRRTLRRR